MTATCCARARRRRCSGTGWRRRRRSGTFLRAFTFGHVRQLDRVLGRERCGAPGRRAPAPATERLVVDVDSFVGEVYGYDKQGAGFGYTHKRGYHPIARDPRRHRRGAAHPAAQGLGEHPARRAALRRGADRRASRGPARRGPKLLRADSGFWNKKIMRPAGAAGLALLDRRAPAASTSRRRSPRSPRHAWQPLDDYPDGGEAQIAETTLGGQRLIVRRTRLRRRAGRAVARLAPLRVPHQPHRRARARRG